MFCLSNTHVLKIQELLRSLMFYFKKEQNTVKWNMHKDSNVDILDDSRT